MEIRPAHFPGRAPIDAYGNGGFRFAEMSHRGSLLCIPSGTFAWTPENPVKLKLSDFELLFAEAANIEILLIGCGKDPAPLDQDLRAAFRGYGIMADPMTTGAAVRTFNVLLAENRAVAAALIAVE